MGKSAWRCVLFLNRGIVMRWRYLTAAVGLLLSLASPVFATEVDELIEAANQGNVKAQVFLATMYRYGFIRMSDKSSVEKNIDEAIRWLKEAAKRQSIEAKAVLGEIYSSDEIKARDDTAAALLLVEVARSNDPDKDLVADAQYRLGILLYQECTTYFIALSCGSNETSPRKDYQAAAHWFELAAKQGNASAKYELASMFEHGRGVPQDFSEAARLYKAAAEAHVEGATGMLGQLYIRMKDPVSAHMWYNISAANDLPWAAERRDKLASQMTPAQLAQAQKLAREYRAAHPTKGTAWGR